jgi:hypothetical protein
VSLATWDAHLLSCRAVGVQMRPSTEVAQVWGAQTPCVLGPRDPRLGGLLSSADVRQAYRGKASRTQSHRVQWAGLSAAQVPALQLQLLAAHVPSKCGGALPPRPAHLGLKTLCLMEDRGLPSLP